MKIVRYNVVFPKKETAELVEETLDLNLIGDEKKLGKPVNSDLKNEKSTYVAMEGIEKTKHEVVRLTEEAVNCLEQLTS